MQYFSKLKNPHDRYFKANMQDMRVARSFFEAHLSVNISKLVDFNTLKLESGTFIDQKLQELVSDLIYSVMIAGTLSYMYLITEHQSTVSELMPFRILQYNCGIMDNHLKQIPKGRAKLLPLVVNIIFYHGTVTPYVQSCDLFDYFAEPDLAREIMLKYITETGEVSDKQKFVNLLTHALPEGAKEMTTLAQDWLKEGYQQGIHAGIEQGIQKGEHEAKLLVARKMLFDNFDYATIKKLTGLHDQDLAKLVKSH